MVSLWVLEKEPLQLKEMFIALNGSLPGFSVCFFNVQKEFSYCLVIRFSTTALFAKSEDLQLESD